MGDEVLAGNPVADVDTTEAVTALHINQDSDLADLYIVDQSGQQHVVHTTQNHPLYDETLSQWVIAAALRPGDQLHTPAGAATVSRVLVYVGGRAMWNLTVANIHTYYVIAGITPVLVHNTGPCGTGLRDSSVGLKGIFGDGGVRGKSIIDIRSQLLENGFSQGLTRNRKGYLFQNGTGEEVRIMRRHGGWHIRVRNAKGNNLDEFGNVASPAYTHDIEVYSR